MDTDRPAIAKFPSVSPGRRAGSPFRSIAVAFLALIWMQAPSQGASPPEHPNILFIYTDDQGVWTPGVYGNRQAHTPNIDRLAREGARLTNAFSTAPVCSPARASLMTGRYSSEVGIHDAISPPGTNT
jgi:hypothetical protein